MLKTSHKINVVLLRLFRLTPLGGSQEQIFAKAVDAVKKKKEVITRGG